VAETTQVPFALVEWLAERAQQPPRQVAREADNRIKSRRQRAASISSEASLSHAL
jgi:hypothetical protein